MTSSRRGAFAATASVLLFAILILLTACGDVYRPVAIPILQPGGDPQSTHFAVVLAKGDTTTTPDTQGTSTLFDVSGDTIVQNRPVGINPVVAAMPVISGLSVERIWVVNQGIAGHDDSTVTTYTSNSVLAENSTVNLEPNAGANAISATFSFVYVTEGSLNKVAIINANTLAVKAFVPVGNNPVAVVSKQDGSKAYVVNKNDSTVTVVSSQDSSAVGSPIAVGSSPVQAVMQSDGAYVYVISQGAGTMSVINTSTDSEVQRVTGLSSPNQVVWDDHLKRVYVVNGGSNTISIFNASNPGALTLLKTVNASAAPVGIAVLDNGVKFYVLYAGAPGTVDVFDAQSFGLKNTITVQNNPVSIAVTPQSSKVYVVNSTGDAGAANPTFPDGSVSIIKTGDDSVLNVSGGVPNPFFVTIQ